MDFRHGFICSSIINNRQTNCVIEYGFTLNIAPQAQYAWSIGIGDPTFLGWFICISYFVACWICGNKALLAKRISDNYPFWLGITIFLLFLGINKQLDLQSLFIQTIRNLSIQHGWYEQRKLVQVAFVALTSFGVLVSLILLRIFLADSWRRYKIVWFGIIFLCTFILLRMALFDRVNVFLHQEDILTIAIDTILELGGIFIIILGAINQPSQLRAQLKPFVNVVEVHAEDEHVSCPRCGHMPTATTKHGRVFKCKSCKHIYEINLVSAR